MYGFLNWEQVQQALQRSHWPVELAMLMALKPAPDTSAPSASALSYTSHVTAEIVVKQQARQSVDSSGETGLMSVVGKPAPDAAVPQGSTMTGRVASMLHYLVGKTTAACSADDAASMTSGSTGDDSAWGHGSKNPRSGNKPSHRTRRNSVASAVSSDRVTKASEGTGITIKLKNKHAKMLSGDVHGLRVRMGISSGWVPAGSDIRVSAVFAMAKGEIPTTSASLTY